MNQSPKKIWLSPCMEWEDVVQQSQSDIPYIREDLVLELVEALEGVVRYAGNNGDDYLADKARAALKKLEESHD